MKTKPLMPFQAVTQTGLLPSPDLVEIIDRLHKNAESAIVSIDWVDVAGIPATFPPSPHYHALSDLTASGATAGQVPQWDGAAWVPVTPSGGGSSPILSWVI